MQRPSKEEQRKVPALKCRIGRTVSPPTPSGRLDRQLCEDAGFRQQSDVGHLPQQAEEVLDAWIGRGSRIQRR